VKTKNGRTFKKKTDSGFEDVIEEDIIQGLKGKTKLNGNHFIFKEIKEET
jgi:hypothetical protein